MGARVRITADFGVSVRKRTYLHLGTVCAVESHPTRAAGQVWVKCPEVERQIDGVFRMWSDGYALLEAGEYEEL